MTVGRSVVSPVSFAIATCRQAHHRRKQMFNYLAGVPAAAAVDG